MKNRVFAAALVLPLTIAVPFMSAAAPAELTQETIRSAFSGELAAAADRLQAGDAQSARKLLEPLPASAPKRVLEERLLKMEGNAAAAGELALSLRNDYPLLADYWAFQAAALFRQAGQADRALTALGLVAAGSRFSAEAEAEKARILEAKGDVRGALSALAHLSQTPAPKSGDDKGAQALLERARLSASLNDAAGQRTELLKVWRDHPGTKLSAEDEKALCLEPSARPASGCPKLTLEDRLTRAERLVNLHRNQRGIAELEPLLTQLKFPSPQGCRARFAYGDAHRKERRHEKAIEILTPVVESCPKEKPKALWSLASSQSIAHPERGPGFYDRYIREFPKASNLDQAQWFAADLEIKNGQDAAVARRLENLVRLYPKSRYAPEALFKRFWMAWTGAADDAARAASAVWLERLLKGWSGNVEERVRARYWLGRVRMDAGDRDGAVAAWSVLAEEAPQRYYGAMALRRLEQAAPQEACRLKKSIAASILGTAASALSSDDSAPGTFAPEAAGDAARADILALLPRTLGPLKDERSLDAALDFLRLGILDEARIELDALARRKQSRDDRVALAILLGLAGDLRGAQWVARVYFAPVFEKPLTAETRGLWTLAWPRAYRPLIEKFCPSRGVEPDLLQSLMREESALDPHARSWAGALGLTQMMPSRAKDVAKLVGRSEFREEQLFEPETAVEFGCAWLGRLLSDFDGEPLHAFAAYNADTRRVRKWSEAVPGGDLDRFVEQIPIAETRGYVKRLVRSAAAYRWLYGAGRMAACE